MSNIPFTKEEVKKYLDTCITHWREFRDNKLNNEEARSRSKHYVDAFQSVRIALFGTRLE